MRTCEAGVGGSWCCGSSRTSSTCSPCSGPRRLKSLSAAAALCSSWPRTEPPVALPGLRQISSTPEASQALSRACSSSSQHLARPSQSWALVLCFEVAHAQRPLPRPHTWLPIASCLSGGCVLLTSQRPLWASQTAGVGTSVGRCM